MPYALVDVELSAPVAPIQLGPSDTGLALVSRRNDQVVGFALHELAPGSRLTAGQVEALLDPHPGTVDPAAGCQERDGASVSMTIAVCTRDRPELLASCLRSLVAGGATAEQILVIDNAPSDGQTRELARRMAVGYEVEPCPGLDFARNRALRVASGDVVAFVDDDVLVDRYWLTSMCQAWQGHPSVAVVTGQVLPLELETAAQVAFERRGGFRRGNDPVRYLGQHLEGNAVYPYGPGMFGAGANLSVRRVTALRLGGFDEALDTGAPLPGGGDIDMMQRVVRSGAALAYDPRAVVFHRHRRDTEGLRRQYDSWGRSSMALAVKTYWADPSGRSKLRRYVRWFFATQARAGRRATGESRPEDRQAARAELRGGLGGVLGTYGRSRRRSQRQRRRHGNPSIAILPWGQVIEDYLDPIGLTIDDFADRQSGGWLFGFVRALHGAGTDTVIICWTWSVSRPTRRIHVPTGAVLWLLPVSHAYRLARARLEDPYGWSRREAIGPGHAAASLADAVAHSTAPFLATTPVALARVLRRESIGTVLCQEYEEGRFDVCVALGRLLRRPVFATFQGGNHTRTRLERMVRGRSIRAAAGFVVADEAEIRRLRHSYGLAAEKVAAIPNPFDPATIPPVSREEARSALGIAADRRVVAWHGRVDIEPKGIDTLVDAWQEVRASADSSDSSALLLLLGTGPGRAWLRCRIEELGLDDVQWTDEYVLDRKRIATHLHAADVYVLPSRHEGFPVSPIEAMAAGLAVVAADAPGVRKIVGDDLRCGGTVVPVGDAPRLAAALRRYLDDEDLAAATGARAARRVDEQFSLAAVGSQLRSFLVDR